MKWEYRMAMADTVEKFQAALNTLGGEGWEAISGAYAAGETRKVSLGHGMPPSTQAGAPLWVALMKRALPQ